MSEANSIALGMTSKIVLFLSEGNVEPSSDNNLIGHFFFYDERGWKFKPISSEVVEDRMLVNGGVRLTEEIARLIVERINQKVAADQEMSECVGEAAFVCRTSWEEGNVQAVKELAGMTGLKVLNGENLAALSYGCETQQKDA